MLFPITGVCKAFVTKLAGIRLVAGVSVHVLLQIFARLAGLAAYTTSELVIEVM